MIPFLHLGPLTIGTYGLMVGVAMIVAYFVLRADFARRGIEAPADLFVAVPALAGLAGSKIYHLLETPREFLGHPLSLLFSQFGFAWFGGFLGGFIAILLLARRYRIGLLEIFDAASPAAALGYGIGRIGCLLSGDGDYGIPTSLPWGMSFPNGLVPTTERVHPTPIYEFIVAALIFWFLWRLGSRQAVRASNQMAAAALPENSRRLARLWERARRRWRSAFRYPALGKVFAWYLLLSGLARFLVEFIRINPRSFFGLTNAQVASLASILLGVALLLRGAAPQPAAHSARPSETLHRSG